MNTLDSPSVAHIARLSGGLGKATLTFRPHAENKWKFGNRLSSTWYSCLRNVEKRQLSFHTGRESHCETNCSMRVFPQPRQFYRITQTLKTSLKLTNSAVLTIPHCVYPQRSRLRSRIGETAESEAINACALCGGPPSLSAGKHADNHLYYKHSTTCLTRTGTRIPRFEPRLSSHESTKGRTQISLFRHFLKATDKIWIICQNSQRTKFWTRVSWSISFKWQYEYKRQFRPCRCGRLFLTCTFILLKFHL